MDSKIIEFISQYISLTEEESRIIEKSKFIKEFNRDDILLKEGEYSNQCFFVLKGCVRAYYLLDGEEKNTEFFVENDTIVPVSYRTKRPSKYFLSCLEDSFISVATSEQSKLLVKNVPKLQNLVAQLNENKLIQKQIMYDDFKNLTVEERYLKLVETRPNLVNRIPQYHLATFLGITPVSLSRLKGRILRKYN